MGKKFTVKVRRHNWGEERVMYFDLNGKLRSMRVSWTDAIEYDPFTAVAAGNSWFRVDDLFELSVLLHTLDDKKNQRDEDVK